MARLINIVPSVRLLLRRNVLYHYNPGCISNGTRHYSVNTQTDDLKTTTSTSPDIDYQEEIVKNIDMTHIYAHDFGKLGNIDETIMKNNELEIDEHVHNEQSTTAVAEQEVTTPGELQQPMSNNPLYPNYRFTKAAEYINELMIEANPTNGRNLEWINFEMQAVKQIRKRENIYLVFQMIEEFKSKMEIDKDEVFQLSSFFYNEFFKACVDDERISKANILEMLMTHNVRLPNESECNHFKPFLKGLINTNTEYSREIFLNCGISVISNPTISDEILMTKLKYNFINLYTPYARKNLVRVLIRMNRLSLAEKYIEILKSNSELLKDMEWIKLMEIRICVLKHLRSGSGEVTSDKQVGPELKKALKLVTELQNPDRSMSSLLQCMQATYDFTNVMRLFNGISESGDRSNVKKFVISLNNSCLALVRAKTENLQLGLSHIFKLYNNKENKLLLNNLGLLNYTFEDSLYSDLDITNPYYQGEQRKVTVIQDEKILQQIFDLLDSNSILKTYLIYENGMIPISILKEIWKNFLFVTKPNKIQTNFFLYKYFTEVEATQNIEAKVEKALNIYAQLRNKDPERLATLFSQGELNMLRNLYLHPFSSRNHDGGVFGMLLKYQLEVLESPALVLKHLKTYIYKIQTRQIRVNRDVFDFDMNKFVQRICATNPGLGMEIIRQFETGHFNLSQLELVHHMQKSSVTKNIRPDPKYVIDFEALGTFYNDSLRFDFDCETYYILFMQLVKLGKFSYAEFYFKKYTESLRMECRNTSDKTKHNRLKQLQKRMVHKLGPIVKHLNLSVYLQGLNKLDIKTNLILSRDLCGLQKSPESESKTGENLVMTYDEFIDEYMRMIFENKV